MEDTKTRIMEFIAKNQRVQSNKGIVILLNGPPGVGKASIAKTIGKFLNLLTAVISMVG